MASLEYCLRSRAMRFPGDDDNSISSPVSKPSSLRASCICVMHLITLLPRKPEGPDKMMRFGVEFSKALGFSLVSQFFMLQH
jgi:hypothetical protein